MTRNRVYALTAAAAGLYALLCWAFADGLFTGTFWDSKAIADSSIWTYVMLAFIVGAGYYQASQLPEEGVSIKVEKDTAWPGRRPGRLEAADGQHVLRHRLAAGPLLRRPRVAERRRAQGARRRLDGAAARRSRATASGRVAIPEGRPAHRLAPTAGSRDFLRYMLDHEWYTWFAKVIAVGEVLVGHRPDRRRAGRDRRLLRHADELQLPAGRLGQHQPGPLRPRRVPGPGLEGRGLDRRGSGASAGTWHTMEARPAS